MMTSQVVAVLCCFSTGNKGSSLHLNRSVSRVCVNTDAGGGGSGDQEEHERGLVVSVSPLHVLTVV